jgi:hypothetical protein
VPAAGPGLQAPVVIPGVYQGIDYRTNVGVINTSGVETEVTVAIVGADGSQIASQMWKLGPYEQKQVPVTDLGIGRADGGYVTFTRNGGEGTFQAYATVVDQHTGDAVYTAGS